MMDLTNPAHAPSIEFQKKLIRSLLDFRRTETALLASMSEEDRLAYLSRQNAPKGCRGADCYGRGYVGRKGDTLIPCRKCTTA